MAFELPRMPAEIPQDYAQFRVWWSITFQPWWQEVVEAIEGQEAIQDEILLALVTALADMPELAAVAITGSYLGVVDPAAQLPKYIQASRLQSTSDVTTTSAWSLTSLTGGVTATVGAATGLVTITAVTGSDTLTVTSVFGGVSKSRNIAVTFTTAAPPPAGGGGGGSGGTTATDTSFASFNSTSMATVSDVLTVLAGAAGEVQLSAPLAITTATGTPVGQYRVYGIWQWDSTGGGVWVDLGAEVLSIYGTFVAGGSGQSIVNGSITTNYLDSGHAPASSQKYRLRMRAHASNPDTARVLFVTGTASAVGQ